MTSKQALAKAIKLWGKRALVQDKGKPSMLNGKQISGRYIVGTNLLGLFFEVRGDGDTWEQAFENAAKHWK